jgi:hypothetical protein
LSRQKSLLDFCNFHFLEYHLLSTLITTFKFWQFTFLCPRPK